MQQQPQPKVPISIRAVNAMRALAGRPGYQLKDFIQPLSPMDGWSLNGSGRLHEFTSSTEQLAANLGWVFAGNKAIVDPCAAVQPTLSFMRKDGKLEDILEHEILELLKGPNLMHTGEQLRNLHYTYLNLTGETYTLMLQGAGEFVPAKGKLPDALQILPSHRVRFKLGKRFTESTIKVGQDVYSIMNVIRDFNPDPGNPSSGRSIIAAMAPALDLESNMMEWNRRFFANNAQTSVVVSIPAGLEPDARERLKQEIDGKHTGAENAFSPWIVEGESTVTQIGIKQNELQFLGTREFSMKEILSMLQVSPGLLGQVTDVNRATLEAMFYQHAVQNVVPRVRQYTNQLNQTLVKVYDPRMVLGFKNPVPGDVEQKLKEIQAAVNVWITADEARAEYGRKPLPNKLGTHIIVQGKTPMTLEEVIEDGEDDEPVDDGDPKDDPKKSGKQPADSKTSKALQPGKAGAAAWNLNDEISLDTPIDDPYVSGTPDSHQPEAALKVLKAAAEPAKHEEQPTAPAEGVSPVKKDQPNPQPEVTEVDPTAEQVEADRQARGDAKVALYRQRAEVYEQSMMTALQAQFNAQLTDILEQAHTEQLYKSMAAVTSRKDANQKKKDWLALLALLGWAVYTDNMRAALAPILYALVVSTGGQALQQIDLDPSMFNPIDIPVLDYSQSQSLQIGSTVNQETEKQIRASLGQGIDKGEDDNSLRARIEKVFGIALTTRAARIARTEVTRAQGFADQTAWQQSGVVTGKIWLVESNNPCAFCEHMDGTVVALSSNFFNSGDVLSVSGDKSMAINEDVPYPPIHPNCLCVLMPVS